MFKIQTSYQDTRVEIEFPCSNNTLYAKLAELHIPDEKKVTAQLFIEEIDYEELKCLENTFVDPDILNYIAQKMDSFDSKELKKSDAEARLAEALKAIKMTRDELKNYSYTYRQTLEIKLKENMPKKYEAVIIFNKPMLFTNERLEYENVPDGLSRYDIRDGGMDGNMRELKDRVAVNHWGTVLSRDAVEPRMIDGKEMNSNEGIVMTDDDYNYTGEVFTTEEYLDNYEYLLKEYCEPEQDKGIVMQ